MSIAMVADALQIGLGPLGMVGVDQGIDLVAAILTIGILGFHPLLLPTFLIELMPVADLLPTWTGCVVIVIAMRKKSRVIDVPSKVVSEPPRLPDQRA